MIKNEREYWYKLLKDNYHDKILETQNENEKTIINENI